MPSWTQEAIAAMSHLPDTAAKEDLYAKARALAVETMRGYQGNDRAGALGTVISEMLSEAMKAGCSVASLSRELRDLEHWLSVQPKE